MKFEYPQGATPLDPDETAGLIPLHITTQAQLNEWEAANILKAENWLISSRDDFLTIPFIKRLHIKMFDDTWKWAGLFRQTEKNIGVTPSMITSELKTLLEDVLYQITHNSYSIDEIAYRFHHRLVAIHPFSNGNGRHARMMTDILLMETGQSRFTWGNKKLETESVMRKQYIAALKKADKRDYSELAKFVRG
jgi:Fic-DOC domain mobile mystery protein B